MIEGERFLKISSLRSLGALVALTGFASLSLAQSALERHVWQEARSFSPVSRTAVAITGEITLSGNDRFAEPGSTMRMTFGNGAVVDLVSEGASWRPWEIGSPDKQTAEVFRLSEDPGPLVNGNSLCGAGEAGEALYAVFFTDRFMDGPLTLILAVFQSPDPPFNINSDGICGTYSFDAEAADR